MGAWKECRVCGEPLFRTETRIFCERGCFTLDVEPVEDDGFDVTDPDNFPVAEDEGGEITDDEMLCAFSWTRTPKEKIRPDRA